MAQISIVEVQSIENVGLSLNTFNSNFKKLEFGINAIENYLNTTPVGGELRIGKIKILQGTGNLNDIDFIVETSGTVNGNFSVGGNINIVGTLLIGETSTFAKSVSFNANAIAETITEMKQRFVLKSDYIVKNTPVLTDEDGVNTVTVKSSAGNLGEMLLTIDVNNITTGIGTNPDNSFISIGPGASGQILKIRFDGEWQVGATQKVTIKKENFASNYSTDIVIDAIGHDIRKASLTLFCDSDDFWTVLDVNAYDNIITY